jgi:Rnl2 family RNA ligase
MGYKKYGSIENDYNSKYINGLLTYEPEVSKITYQLTEKIDGSNFQIYIEKDLVRYGRRTGWLKDNDGFNDWQSVVAQDKIQDLIHSVQDTLKAHSYIQFYGELYGPGVQKRIPYGDKKDLKLFEMKIDGQWQTPEFMENFLVEHASLDLHVPVLGYVEGLEEAMKFDIERPSALYKGDEAHVMEGMVIKPYYTVLKHRNSHVRIKKRNAAFLEKMKVKVKTYKPTVYTELQQEFMQYINENRLMSVISKYGPPKTKKDIGKYLSLLSQDAFQDFAKDQGWDIYNLDKSVRRTYMPLVSKLGSGLVISYLENEEG